MCYFTVQILGFFCGFVFGLVTFDPIFWNIFSLKHLLHSVDALIGQSWPN